MNIKLFFAALMLTFSLPASADFEVISQAHEIALSNFRAPATPNGGLTYKACPTCEIVSVRVTPNTQYVVNNRPVKLEQFRQALAQVSDRDSVPVIVVHHLESDTIVSVLITI